MVSFAHTLTEISRFGVQKCANTKKIMIQFLVRRGCSRDAGTRAASSAHAPASNCLLVEDSCLSRLAYPGLLHTRVKPSRSDVGFRTLAFRSMLSGLSGRSLADVGSVLA